MNNPELAARYNTTPAQRSAIRCLGAMAVRWELLKQTRLNITQARKLERQGLVEISGREGCYLIALTNDGQAYAQAI